MSTPKPGELAWSIIEPYWISLNETWLDDPASFLERLQTVPVKVGHLYAGNWCVSEVGNGGLYQFFYNTTGILAPEAVAGFRAVGLTECEQAVSEAMEFFSSPYPRNRPLRLAQLPDSEGRKRKDWDPFQELDERFYDCTSEKDCWERAADRYALSGG